MLEVSFKKSIGIKLGNIGKKLDTVAMRVIFMRWYKY